ncbi:hypothetical protein ROJ8625_02303 [Roseivivax jejudonensis]|uniref:YjiS-like domain-containing protein n=1 Tax=Roseivivax jejudonensis TaxID=1529041 RepID=A0A1X6ZEJ1_9RHOB|nr:hypothetical protein [Roseivivax jejudonensis]SLN47349.1 hypothetical protein ROJ8625_02303 [Roseivivax jejudonensis]
MERIVLMQTASSRASGARGRLRLGRMLGLAAALQRERRQLAGLDAERLRDIGISADAARTEAARPVWDAPERWRR